MEKYLINKEIGSGSFGKVFVVESKSTGIQYVAKQVDTSRLSARQRQLAEKEFHLLSKFKHPNIVSYKEAFVDERSLHIVMELCELGDLHSAIQDTKQRNQTFSDSQVMHYFVQICHAISYIHQQRILHRDLKTKNIFLKKGNIVKLGDFGVAKSLENSFELAHTCIGSPFYISPEICENKPYDRKSDIWALGCVLFEVVTLKYAFQAKNMKSLLHKITTGQHTAFPCSTNPNIRQIIKKLLHGNPRLRPNISDILSLPFVAQHNTHHACKLPPSSAPAGKSVKMLPISKSCLNLKESGISVPEDKYKSQVKPIKMNNTSGKLQRLNNLDSAVGKNVESTKDIVKNIVGVSNLKERRKIIKLPKADCLYYNLIEKNKRAEEERTSNLSLLQRAKRNNPEDDCESPVAEENNSAEPLVDVNVYSQQSFTSKLAEDDGVNKRKRWQTDTAGRQQLLSLLHDADLQPTNSFSFHDTVIFKGDDLKGSKSLEEMLCMGTTELRHVAQLPPVLRPSSVPINIINDTTFVIHPQEKEMFEKLEQRRMILEKELGAATFLAIYKKIETMNLLCDENFLELEEVAAEFLVSTAKVRQVCQLVTDDLIYI